MLIAVTVAVLAIAVSIPAFAYLPNIGGGPQVASPKQIEECKALGIPEFTCTEQTLLAKKRVIEATRESAGKFLGDSGTAMFGRGFGEMGAFVAALGTIFGGVAAAFFARAKMGKKVPI